MKKFLKILVVIALMAGIGGVVISGCSKDGSPSSSGSSYSGTYIGNVNTYVFHKTTCSYLPAPANQTTFAMRQDAITAGYTPCGHCNP